MSFRKCFVVLSVVVVCTGAALPVSADWFPEDGHKMHFPQLPDPTGWDVSLVADTMFDDWQCSSTGTVDDVHFWTSWRGDQPSDLLWIDLSIWSDVPANDPSNQLGISYPGAELWADRFQPGEWRIAAPEVGLQGWFNPQPPEDQVVIPNDHQLYYQINIEDIENPFVQEEGKIYWLGIHIGPSDPNTAIGWKTSQDHWNDDAVYWWTIPGSNVSWRELIDPATGESLDMAFVITGSAVPEPGSLVLGLAGLLGLASWCAWRRRPRD